MRRIQEIEIELPQIVLERADAAYAQIRQQASQEKQLTGKRFPRAAGILLAVVILSVTAVSATAAGIMGYRRYLAERMTDIGTEELGHLEMVAGQGSVQAEFNRELTAREQSVYEQLTREYEEDGKYPAGQLHEFIVPSPPRTMSVKSGSAACSAVICAASCRTSPAFPEK